MKKLILGTLLATTFYVPVHAADFAVVSQVDKVTVFPQGADVTRVATVKFGAGDHRIILADLPASVDARSIRVEGVGLTGLAISSVDTKVLPLDEKDYGAQAKSLQEEINGLSVERSNLDQTIADGNHQRQFLLSLADKQLSPQSTTDTVKGIDVQQLTGMLDLISQRLSSLATVIQTAQAKQRDIDEKMATLSNQLNTLAPQQNQRLETVINVEASGDVSGEVRISYRLNEAAWLPYYDAKLDVADKVFSGKLDLVRRAEVTQWSGERWDNIELVLSTTRPSGTTAAPILNEEEIMAQRERRKDAQMFESDTLQSAAPVAGAAKLDEEMADDGEVKIKKLAKPEAIEQRQAIIEMAGFQASYAIAGRLSVDNSGTAKKVRIASAVQDVALEIQAVPMLDATAYLTAQFKLAGDGPLLPGYVNLYRSGVYLGQGTLPLLNPGEEAELGFGADDLVKIERTEVKKTIGEEGLLTSSNVEERAWDISIKNLHDMAVKITVLDRMPFASDEDIAIERLDGMTAPTRINDEKRRGVMAYNVEVAAKADSLVKTGYRIAWPENMKIGAVE